MTMTNGSRTESGKIRDRRVADADPRYSRRVSVSRDFSTAEASGRGASISTQPRRVMAPERRHTTRALVNPGVQPTRKRLMQHKLGSQQVMSVRGRRVEAKRADPKVIQLSVLVVILLCVGVGATMGLSGTSTQQTFQLQELQATETDLSNRIESLNRDVEDARSAATLAANATEMGLVSPVEPGVLAVQENGDVVEEREANPETRPIVDINGQQTRPNRASSNPDETNAVTENLQAIPQEAAAPPYQTNTVPYAATTGQAGGAGQ
ncbi:hypothetical protein CS176_1913 [Corynebacterium glutamicum]|uniref:hypothetical protein n=1 Tax=Corynebacterium glutamicum TaxID=1718 RepID=UPI00097B98F1|nr:hypothetical protein [Corynebacterium glutamicum]GAV97683.1 hypothetical protein CS176_1913 [Corynebacterium glutamicum]HJE11266.1 hypothetical protein [Corynebacterium glutamicum]